MLDYLKALFFAFFHRASNEVLESVDDILADFTEKVDRLQAANARAIGEAESLEARANYCLHEADTLREEAARADYVAKKIKSLVG